MDAAGQARGQTEAAAANWDKADKARALARATSTSQASKACSRGQLNAKRYTAPTLHVAIRQTLKIFLIPSE